MKNKLYVMIALFCTGLSGILQATDHSAAILNNTSGTVYVQLNYKKNGHTSTQGRQVTVQAGQTVTVTYVDTLTNVYVAKESIPVNKDGCAGAHERKRVTSGITEVSLPSFAGKPEGYYISGISIGQQNGILTGTCSVGGTA